MDKEELRQRIVEALKNVYDPEIPIDVWNLGLIYEINIKDEGVVDVKMTLTAPGCPVANMILYQVMDALQNVEGVKDVNVELVFDPPWDPTKMTEEGREKFKQVFGYDIVEEYLRQKEVQENP
ncbi:MAG: FeS assembly SUF system protein [Thermoprotei archaeon]|nr:MAG: FeS assembly SUF system protein [Thermoprotei archaeon]